MPLNDATLNVGAVAMQAKMTHASLHTATPNTSGSNASSAARKAITWDTPAGGDMVATTDILFTGGAPLGTITHIGFWDASTGGNFAGYVPATGDTSFNSAGEATVTGLSIPGTAS